jgi:DNA replication and repair protein RecF
VRLRTLNLRHFRNVTLARLEFTGRLVFCVGANAQGKTNLLEAIGLLTALRSFRTTDNRLLLMHNQPLAALVCELEHEKHGPAKVSITLRRDGKEVWCDQTRVPRLADFIGRFPTVAFSSQDLQLIRGSPAGRRRWLDVVAAAMEPDYLRALQAYDKALDARNSLLKAATASDAELEAFEAALAPPAAVLIARRQEVLHELARHTTAAYAKLANGADLPGLAYRPDFGEEPDPEVLLARLAANRDRDRQFRTTVCGPHRDDLELTVGGRGAKDFGSEGQQRSLVLALRLAQAAWFHEKGGVRPVLLADDVLGELDDTRRREFWRAIDPESQVIATGTAPPGSALGDWQVFRVADGEFTPEP